MPVSTIGLFTFETTFCHSDNRLHREIRNGITRLQWFRYFRFLCVFIEKVFLLTHGTLGKALLQACVYVAHVSRIQVQQYTFRIWSIALKLRLSLLWSILKSVWGNHMLTAKCISEPATLLAKCRLTCWLRSCNASVVKSIWACVFAFFVDLYNVLKLRIYFLCVDVRKYSVASCFVVISLI